MSATITQNSKGVFPISITPFKENGDIDFESTDRLTDFYLEKGADGLTILGIMGEAHKLTSDEAIAFTKRVLRRVNGSKPVIVGASSGGLDNQARFAKAVMDEGAAGLMIAPASGLATEKQVIGYFDMVFNAIGPDVPVVYQDYPALTGVAISVDTLHRLVDDHPQIVVLKHEEFPGLQKISQIREAEKGGQRRLSILCGNGAMHLCQELMRGADGAMTGFSFPEVLVKICALFEKGKPEEAEDLYDAHMPLLRQEYQPGMGLAVRKEILRRRGAIECAAARLPGPKMSAVDLADLDRLLERLGRKLEAVA